MYSIIKGITWTVFIYSPVLIIPWIISAVTNTIYIKIMGSHKLWFAALIPAVGTALNAYDCTGKLLFSIISVILCYLCWLTWNPVLCICYILYLMCINCALLYRYFPNSVALLGCVGVYKIIIQWKEIIGWLSYSKEKNTKKTMDSKRPKQSMMKKQSLR